MADNHVSRPHTPEETRTALDTMDGIMGAAGHKVTDPHVRSLYAKYLSGELSGDEVRRRIAEYRGL